MEFFLLSVSVSVFLSQLDVPLSLFFFLSVCLSVFVPMIAIDFFITHFC